MKKTPTKKPRNGQTSLELSPVARGALRRIKKSNGITFTRAIERGVMLLELKLNQGKLV